VVPRFGNIGPKFSPETFCKYLGVLSGFSNVSPQLLPESFTKMFRMTPTFSYVSLKLLPQLVCKTFAVAPGIRNIRPQRLGGCADDPLNLRQRFQVHMIRLKTVAV